MNQKGISIVSILVIVLILGLLIGGGFVLLNKERSKSRDAQRLADMARVQVAFEFLYNETASYELAAANGCSQAGMPLSACNLKQYLPSIGQFADPGKYSYTVEEPPTEEGYSVSFTLENSYYDLSAGKHILSEQGIK